MAQAADPQVHRRFTHLVGLWLARRACQVCLLGTGAILLLRVLEEAEDLQMDRVPEQWPNTMLMAVRATTETEFPNRAPMSPMATNTGYLWGLRPALPQCLLPLNTSGRGWEIQSLYNLFELRLDVKVSTKDLPKWDGGYHPAVE
jgi:hypothetical protein